MSRAFGDLKKDPAHRYRGVEPSSPDKSSSRAPGEWAGGLEAFGIGIWELPGQGESGPRCGEWYPNAVCQTCGEPSFSAHACGNRSCPDCWGMWAKQAAVRAATRLQSFRTTQPPDGRRQAAHAIVSPPEGEVRSKEQYWRWRSRAAEIAEEKGWRGFAVIPHPYRVTDEGKRRYREADPACGIWAWLRRAVDDMDRFTKWSPHYHIVGATGPDMEPASDEDEYVYHFRRSLARLESKRDVKSHDDVYGLFRYILSHTGYPEGSQRQSIAWYGSLANNVFVENATEEWQYEKPSDGVRSVIERYVERVAARGDGESGDGGGESGDDRGDGPDDDTLGECPCDDCGGALIDVFDVGEYLRRHDPPPDVVATMKAARAWRLGRRRPPPGLKRPQSEADAREALSELR